MMNQAWKILDEEYGCPKDVAREGVDRLMQLRLTEKTELLRFLSYIMSSPG